MKSCSVVKFFLSAGAWIRAYLNMLFTQAFWRALLWPRIILCPPLPPSRHNHTCLILSNLSFIVANQLPRCALFHHLLPCDSIIFSPPHPRPPALPVIFPHFSPSLSCCAFPCHGIRVNLDPSKRQGSNKSVSGCTLPQGSKTVSKFPCLSLLSCLPVLPRLSAWSHGNLLQSMNACLTLSYLYLWIIARLHDLSISPILSRSHTLGFKHGCNQGRSICFVVFNFQFQDQCRCQWRLALTSLLMILRIHVPLEMVFHVFISYLWSMGGTSLNVYSVCCWVEWMGMCGAMHWSDWKSKDSIHICMLYKNCERENGKTASL